jgi:hypothetical protein
MNAVRTEMRLLVAELLQAYPSYYLEHKQRSSATAE